MPGSRRSLAVAAIGVLLAYLSAAGAQEPPGPSFPCEGELTATESKICDDPRLAFLDRELGHLFGSLPPASPRRVEQRAWIERRDRCRDDEGCLEEVHLDRLAALQSQPRGLAVGGTYRYAIPGETGRMIAVPRPDGLAVAIETVTGPTYHICNFTGVLPRADDYTDLGGDLRALAYRTPDGTDGPDGEPCRVGVVTDGRTARVEAQGCRLSCGARGYFDGIYVRE